MVETIGACSISVWPYREGRGIRRGAVLSRFSRSNGRRHAARSSEDPRMKLKELLTVEQESLYTRKINIYFGEELQAD